MNAEELEALARAGRRRPLFEPAAAHALDLDRAAVQRLIPHRDPFLFVDRVVAADLDGRSIAGRRRIDPADPVFRGHFPDEPVYPGVLQIETIGQLGLCLFGLVRNGRVTVGEGDRPPPARGIKVHQAVFTAPVRPGDELLILARELESDSYTASCAGQILVGATICCFAVMEVYFVEA